MSPGFPWKSAIWGATALGALTILLALLPQVVEQVVYAVRRAPEQAAADAARAALDGFDAESFGSAMQLVAKRIAPSVVHINVQSRAVPRNAGHDWLLLPQPPVHGQGSGVIVDESGYILTNEHVVRGAPEVQVQLSDGSRHRAEIVGTDQLMDLAVLRVRTERKLTPAAWGDSDQMQVGSFVWAVGSPFGLDHTITYGILSAKDRSGVGSLYQDFLQTDAAINPGNSGGPLVNIKGEIIGINTAIVGQVFAGIGFAIPSTQAKEVYLALREKGSIEHGWLGVEMAEVSPQMAERLKLDEARGVLVVSVVLGSPAAEAGIKIGDVIVRFDGEKLDSPTALARRVAKAPIGSKAKLFVRRGDHDVEVEVTLGKRAT